MNQLREPSDDDCPPWEHETAPLPEAWLDAVGIELIDPMAASRGHKNTIAACRRLFDEVQRLRAMPIAQTTMTKVVIVPNHCGTLDFSQRARAMLRAAGCKVMTHRECFADDPGYLLDADAVAMFPPDDLTLVEDLARHDPRLVAVVEALGAEASGDLAFGPLKIVEVRGRYRIRTNYHGDEWIEEPHTVAWIDAGVGS